MRKSPCDLFPMERGSHCPPWFPWPGPDGRLRGEPDEPLIGLIRRQIGRGDVFVLQVLPGAPFTPTNSHRSSRNREAICCLLNILKGPPSEGRGDRWGMSTVPTGSQSRYSENPAFCFFSLFRTVGEDFIFYFTFIFFFIFGVYLVFTSIWRRPARNPPLSVFQPTNQGCWC